MVKYERMKITVIGSFFLFLVACSPAITHTSPNKTAPPPAESQPDPQNDELQMTQPDQLSSPSFNLKTQIEKAKKDLSQRLSIAVAEINLLEAREVVWRSAFKF